VIIGALESQRAEHTLELLGPAPGKASFTAAAARDSWALLIGGVGVEPLLNRSGREPQRAMAQGDFPGLEIQLRDRLPT